MKAEITITFEVDPEQYHREFTDVPAGDQAVAEDIGKLTEMAMRAELRHAIYGTTGIESMQLTRAAVLP